MRPGPAAVPALCCRSLCNRAALTNTGMCEMKATAGRDQPDRTRARCFPARGPGHGPSPDRWRSPAQWGDHPGRPWNNPATPASTPASRCRPWDDNPRTVAPGAAKQPAPAASPNRHPAPGPAAAAPAAGGIGLHQLIERQGQQHQSATVQAAQITGGLIHQAPLQGALHRALAMGHAHHPMAALAQIQPQDPPINPRPTTPMA